MPVDFENIIEDHKKFLSIGNNTFHYIFDCNKLRFEYLSPSFTEETGYAIDEALYNSNFSLTPIEDYGPIVKTLGELLTYFVINYREHINQYTTFYYYPLLHKNGNVYPCLVQVRILDFNEDGSAKNVLAYNQIIHKKYDKNKAFNMSFISHDHSLPSFYQVDSLESLKQGILIRNLSKREIEILKLVSEGYSNNSISSMLNISIHTISTHKKNIISKTNTSNIMVAIQKAILQKIF
ncbi:LuxR C-terminal-related transcriptional regulator [Flammeovirga aprica]|uniref:LuxR family transcriptional regulator n=1 Tax=Flammeovirga aprica JL-4 TaxID=694437 RepID=A0A7X9P0S2_9BACT|nr:LuxR C-terminal-related transcriptional regulator [Flammeovirga aprica]NME67434.1 LuxR family transcriptional regulator [Flammeovirga aprica JL-4]